MQTVQSMCANGWSMASLARALRVDPATVYRWRERGETKLVQLALTQLDATETPERYRDDGPLLTYFIRCGDAVKIGCARNIRARLATLQTGSAAPLELLATTTEPESVMHSRFAMHRLRGEWFALTPEILEQSPERRCLLERFTGKHLAEGRRHGVCAARRWLPQQRSFLHGAMGFILLLRKLTATRLCF